MKHFINKPNVVIVTGAGKRGLPKEGGHGSNRITGNFVQVAKPLSTEINVITGDLLYGQTI